MTGLLAYFNALSYWLYLNYINPFKANLTTAHNGILIIVNSKPTQTVLSEDSTLCKVFFVG